MPTPPSPPRDDLRFSNTTGILQKKKSMWFIGAEVEQETSAPPPKKNPGSAPETSGQEPLNLIMALCMKVLKLFWPLVLTPVDQDC